MMISLDVPMTSTVTVEVANPVELMGATSAVEYSSFVVIPGVPILP
jgi:hypothetical protein